MAELLAVLIIAAAIGAAAYALVKGSRHERSKPSEQIDPGLLQASVRSHFRSAVTALDKTALSAEPVEVAPFPDEVDVDVWMRRFVQLAGHRYGLPVPNIRVEYTVPASGFLSGDLTSVPASRPAGTVRRTGDSWVIEVSRNFREDRAVLGAILAHEVAHILLDTRHIRPGSSRALEELTDTVAVLAGFGGLLMSASSFRDTRLSATIDVGYLDYGVLRQLSQVRELLRSGRVYRHDAGQRAASEPAYVACPACETKLRLPRLSAAIVLTCPFCRLRQRVSVSSESPAGPE